MLELPTDRARPAVQNFAGASQSFSLSTELSGRLREVSRREGVTLYMLLLAAFQTLLYRQTGQTDVVVGTAISNRNLAEVEGVIGFFVNTLVLRTDVSGNPSFKELLGRVRAVCLGAYSNQDVPFEKLVEELRPERSLSHTPLFQVMFALQYAPSEMLTLSDLTVSRLQLERLTTHFDLMLGIQDSEQGLAGTFEYSTELFEEESIRRMAEHYQRLLGAIAADPQLSIAEIPLLSATELQLQLNTWNETAAEYPRDESIQALFEAQVERAPEAVAVICDQVQITYGELNERANRLAYLLRRQGVRTETAVGICQVPSVEMVVSILAVLKAGGAYVPLDAEYPVERLSFMCTDAGLQVVLTSREQCARLPSEGITKLCVEELSKELLQQPSGNRSVAITGDHLAYIVYTSGSTGIPKGICIPHHAVTRLVFNTNYISFSPSDTVAQLSNASFDALTFELWGALLHGGRLVILSREVALSVVELSTALREHNVSAMFLTTALFNEVAQQRPDSFEGVRAVLFGGDTADVRSVRNVLRHGGPERLLNVYGPTEATTFSSWEEVSEVPAEARSVPIGKPLGNTELYVLDERMRPAPLGVRGELYIGGEGLARGYLNRAELTAERFVPHPYGKLTGGRLYRTGDVVRQLPDGRLEFIGRADQQVKLRGFRIELAEIEAVLRQHAEVKDAVVVVREDEHRGKLLIAYVVKEEHATRSSDDLRGYLRETLPEYMVPVAFVELSELPLNANGKVDRKALPEADREERGGDYVRPRTPVEEVLAGIWCEVMGLERVGIYENFFELGGHSLLATQVASRVRDAFNIELPLKAVFELQTIAELSQNVDAAANVEHDASLSQIQRAPRDQVLPLSFAQQRLWFLDQLNPDSAAYNIPAVVRLTGVLNVEALEHTLSEIIRRHESLRTTFQVVDGQPVQVINEAGIVRFSVIDVSALDELAREAESERLIHRHTKQQFDLSQETMLRPGLLRLAADEHILMMTMHHIVSDGWSMGVLIREMATLYATYLDGAKSPLAELPIQYADYAIWQREWLQGLPLEGQLAYWRKQLAGASPTINLPTDRPRPAVQTFESEAITFELSESLSTALRSLSQQENVTLFMTLMAAYNTLLYKYTGQEDILVGTGIANRNRSEIEGLIGFFVNMLVVRTDLSGDPSFLELLRRVRETAFAAYAHQDLPFEKLVEELQPERDLSHTPFFQVTFVLQNVSSAELSLPGLEVSFLDFKTGAAKFDLILSMSDMAKGLSGTLEYNTNLFDAATIQRMLGHFRKLLETVVDNPQRPVSQLSLLSEPEQRCLLADWNDTRADYPSETCIHYLFEQQAAGRTEELAMVYNDERVTYGELNRRANQLAHHLRSLGVGPESHVGICLERSTEMVVAVLGVMKAGGAYVPLDPRYPLARLEYMLEDAQVEVLLTQESLLVTLPKHHATVTCVDTERETIARQSTGNPSSGVTADNLVYIIYTSGSTGKPKGVLVQHGGLCNLTEAQLKTFDIQPNSRTLQFASLSFDASIFEIVMAWRSGATLYLTSEDLALPGAALAQLLREQAVTHVTLSPSVLAVMPDEQIPSLRTIIVAGEACPAELVQRWGVGRRFFNAYGPTEATVWATVAECQPNGQRPTIGQPIINAQIYLLDSHLQPVPVGVPGELHIGSVGLARGYLNCPDLTATRFIPNPFSSKPGSRLYKTGDLARFMPGGDIDYLGRIDHQVKVRGFRIELGEVESVLGQYQGVRDVVLLAKGDTLGDSRIVAYVVPEGNAVLNINELRQHLNERLPEYMVPASFVMLEALPLTSNGKVDRRALLQLNGSNQESELEYIAPRNETEQIIAAIWQDALQTEKVGIDDNFFDLGGHSLLMVGVHNKLKERFKKDLPIADLFKHPTVRLLTQCFNEETKQTSSQSIRDRAKKQKEAAMRKRLTKKQSNGGNGSSS
jgi:amino acid adenylation domain-containing protein